MPDDLERLIVQFSADMKGYEKEMRKFRKISQREARAVEKRFKTLDRRLNTVGRNIGRSLTGGLTGIGAVLSTREVTRYADAWTSAKNKIAAASQISGLQARSLEDVEKIANDSRSGISATVDLYARLLRSSKLVTKSEQDVARVTEIVAKSFKAGGSAASEQASGIIQLGQALGSGFLQGEELKAIRENAPLLAQAIADEFGVAIGELRDLGAAAELTSERVFKAILNGQGKIEAAFAATTPTIQDAFTKIDNAFTRYIGQTDESLGASQRLIAGLEALADNFDQTADVALQLAGVLAGALLGRSILQLLVKVPAAATALAAFAGTMRKAGSVSAALRLGLVGVAGAVGPIGLIIGAAATATAFYASSVETAADKSAAIVKELEAIEKAGKGAASGINAVTAALDKLPADKQELRLRKLREELARLKGGGGGFFDFERLPFLAPDIRSLGSLRDEFQEIAEAILFMDEAVTQADRDTALLLSNVAEQVGDGTLSLDEAAKRFENLPTSKLSKPVLELIDKLRETLNVIRLLTPEVERAASAASRAADAAGRITSGSDDARHRERVQGIARQQAQDKFFSQRDAEAAKSAFDKLVDQRTKEIVEAGKKVGAAISEADARIRAATEIRAEQVSSASRRGLLDLIKLAEGTFGKPQSRGYNTTLGYGAFTGGPITLVDKTLREILAIQKQMLAHPDNTFNSSAVGAYQIVSTTLRSLINELGLSLDQLFTPELQDRLGNALVERRGRDVSGLRNEWEGLRNVSSGTILSAYDNTSTIGSERGRQIEELQRENQARQEILAGLNQQILALQQEKDLIGATTFEREKANLVAEAEQQLRQAGIEITPEIRAQLEQLGTQYGTLASQIEQAQLAQQQFADVMGELKDATRDVLGGFIRDLRDGASVAEAAGRAFERLGDRFLDLALDALFSQNALGGLFGTLAGGAGGGGGGFNLLSLFGLGKKDGGPVQAFASGGFVSGPGGPRDDKVPALLSDGEFVVNAAAYKKNRKLVEAINAGQLQSFADGGLISNVNATLANASRTLGTARQSQINVAAPNVTVPPPEVVVVDSEQAFYDRLSSAKGEAMIVDITQRNQAG